MKNKLRARQRRYYRRHRAQLIEAATERTRRNRKKNAARYRAYARRGYQKNRAANLRRVKAWKKRNAERMREINRVSHRKCCRRLTDGYVRQTLRPILGVKLPADLIEIKRITITIERLIRKQ